jgi:hypothetical protein
MLLNSLRGRVGRVSGALWWVVVVMLMLVGMVAARWTTRRSAGGPPNERVYGLSRASDRRCRHQGGGLVLRCCSRFNGSCVAGGALVTLSARQS